MKSTSVVRLLLCAVAVLHSAGLRAQIEGNLFTQPEEREYLDYLREEFLRTSAEDGFDIEETDIPEVPVEVVVVETAGPVEYSFGGVMTRRDGSHSIWLNGVLLAESELPEGFSVVENDSMVSLRIVQDGATYLLRPGQSVNAGIVTENLQRSPEAPVPTAAPEEVPATTTSESNALEEAANAAGEVLETATAAAAPESILNDDVDSAVARLSNQEAAALAAALERRSAGSTAPETQVTAVEGQNP